MHLTREKRSEVKSLIGYVGMALLLGSYMLPMQGLLYAQLGACVCLLTYAALRRDRVFIPLQAACLALLVVRLAA